MDEKDVDRAEWPVVATQLQVANHFDVAEDAVRKWKKNGMPGSRGNWDTWQIHQWRQLRQQRRNGKSKSMPAIEPDGQSALELDARRRYAETITKEMQAFQHLRNTTLEFERLANIDDVERIMADFLIWIRDQSGKLIEAVVAGMPPDVQEPLQEDLTARVGLLLKGARGKLDDLEDIRLRPKANVRMQATA